MGRYCSSDGSRRARIVGIVLMVAGLLLILFSMPGWLWCTLLGVILISVGYLIWRFARP